MKEVYGCNLESDLVTAASPDDSWKSSSPIITNRPKKIPMFATSASGARLSRLRIQEKAMIGNIMTADQIR